MAQDNASLRQNSGDRVLSLEEIIEVFSAKVVAILRAP
jgi:hypothetical protein